MPLLISYHPWMKRDRAGQLERRPPFRPSPSHRTFSKLQPRSEEQSAAKRSRCVAHFISERHFALPLARRLKALNFKHSSPPSFHLG